MSYDNPRIKLGMTTMDILMSLAEGNPGAITTMMALMKANPTVDPDDAFEELGPLLALDTLDCYGSRIWMFYKDLCDCDITMMLGIMRANQLGFTSDKTINAAIHGARRGDLAGLDKEDLLAKVKERLPAFGKNSG